MKQRRSYLSFFIILLLLIGCVLPINAADRSPSSKVVDEDNNKITFKSLAQNLSANDGLIVDSSTTPDDLVQQLLGTGVTVSNVQFTGAPLSKGTFSGGMEIIGFEGGIVLSSGKSEDVVGPNQHDGIGSNFSTPGDPDLSQLIDGINTNDAAVLEFDFVPQDDVISFMYVFASDEYNEYVFSFNDVFGFFVNGKNVAVIPDTETPVSIDNINGGKPFGSENAKNSEYYRNNDLSDLGESDTPINTEMDGLTTVLYVEASVTPNETNHIKLAIADAIDTSLDSVVFIKAGSFSGKPIERGEIQFDKANYTVDENDSNAVITVARTNGSDGEVSVAYNTSDDTATNGLDYTNSSGTLVFKDGETSKTFTVPIIDDSESEGNESLILTLATPNGGAILGAQSSSILEIIDDEQPPNFYLSESSYLVSEDEGEVTITVFRTENTNTPILYLASEESNESSIYVSYKTTDGSATSPDDYSGTSDTLYFSSDELYKSFIIPIEDDYEVEGNELFNVELFDPSYGYQLGEPENATVTIEDDDISPQIYFSQSEYTVAESVYGHIYGNTATIDVHLNYNWDEMFSYNGSSETVISVVYNTSNGSATSSLDYINTSGTIFFYSGDNDKSFDVTILDDSIYEGSETVNLTLSNQSNGIALGNPSTAILTIIDNESAPPSGGDDDNDGGGGGGSSGSPAEKPPKTDKLPKGTIIDRMPGYITLSEPSRISKSKSEIVLNYDEELLEDNPNHTPRVYYWNTDKKNWVALASYNEDNGKVKAVNDGNYKGWFVVLGVLQPEFSDIENHWAEQVINRMNGLGMIEGYDNSGELRVARPNKDVTIAEFTAFVSRLLNIDIDDPKLPLLSEQEAKLVLTYRFEDSQDIPTWVLREAGTLTNSDLLSSENEAFRGNISITRVEAAVMISKALKLLTDSEIASLDEFSDSNDIPDWAKGEISKNVLTGYPDGSLRPNMTLTRAEAIVLLHRLFVEGLGW